MRKEDLEHLTNQELRDFYTEEDFKKLPSPIKEYALAGEPTREIGPRLNEVEKIISQIVIERFAEGKL